jgi:hypothetical protein
MGAVAPLFAHAWRRSDCLGALGGESGGLAARLLALADDHKF